MNTNSGNKKITTDAYKNEPTWEDLVKCRLEKNLSVEDVVFKLKITEGYVLALEQGLFNQLPAPAFARGYIRNYARLLELDEHALVRSFNASMGEADDDIVLKDTSQSNLLGRGSSSLLRYAVTLLAVLVIIIASYWWHQSKEVVDGGSSKQPQIEVEAESLAPDVSTDDAAVVNDVERVESVAIVSDGKEESPSVITNFTTTSMLQQLGVAKLFIHFNDDCWMEVRNDMGDVLMTGVKSAGADLEMVVPAIVKLLIGNAYGVGEIKFGGRSVDISKRLTGKKVARLTLNVSKI